MNQAFKDAWDKADLRRGWMRRTEAWLLWHAAMDTPERGTICEIGSYRGRSATLFAETGRNVVCVDPLIAGWGDGNNMEIDEGAREKFQRVVDSYPNMTWHCLRSLKVDLFTFRKPIDLLYIDADHLYPAPLEDFLHYAPKIPRKSYVAFHDYPTQPGVKQSVDELVKSNRIEKLATAGGLWLGVVA